MSSRLPYSEASFKSALKEPEGLAKWEQSQYAHFQKRVGKNATVSDLIAVAEAAMRLQKGDESRQYLQQALKRSPQEGDAVYLHAMLLLGQEQKAEARQYLEQMAPKLRQKKPDHARVHALLAAQLMEHDTAAASRHLKQAIDAVGGIKFTHAATRQHLDARELEFDLEVFNAMYPWDQSPLKMRFVSVNVDAQGQVYILENRHRWVFVLHPDGRLKLGLTERDLAAAPFVFPELSWDLTDAAPATQGGVWMSGSSDRIFRFDAAGAQQESLNPPAGKRTLRPLSLASDAQGNLFVLYLHLGGIHWFNSEGAHMGSFGQNTVMGGLGKNYFCGLATTPTGQVLLFDRDQIQLFEPGQPQAKQHWELPESVRDSVLEEDFPFCWNGIAADAENIYFCDIAGHQVWQLNRQSGACSALPLKLQAPFDLALDAQGALYIADAGSGRILKYKAGQSETVLLGHSAFKGAVV